MRIELSIILQILLESLPVSSSGNLALLSVSLPDNINYACHAATLAVYALFFRKKIVTLLAHPLRCKRAIIRACVVGICALVPTLVCYAAQAYMPQTPLALGFAITSLALFSLAYAPGLARSSQPVRRSCLSIRPSVTRDERRLEVFAPANVSREAQALIIGSAQGAALLMPGLSRLGITYAVGRWLGHSYRTAFYFSCMIEAPLLIVASLKGLYSLRTEIISVSYIWWVAYLLAHWAHIYYSVLPIASPAIIVGGFLGFIRLF